ncbi:hypothetical protein T459_23026 [Capsicum annuum]|uniref:Uncharacterized protein n=1 Tax=Capsicum annuum TaxID=4072 RepID=A0A2G2YRJ3_CAPAN|nr:hypothetical protein T459_23026 [Capsicum annuum]
MEGCQYHAMGKDNLSHHRLESALNENDVTTEYAMVTGTKSIKENLSMELSKFKEKLLPWAESKFAAKRDTLGLMNPLSRRFFNYSFNSLSSVGAILYGRIDTGLVSGRRSILESISLLGGTLGRSSGNTSGNSYANDTDSRLEVSE